MEHKMMQIFLCVFDVHKTKQKFDISTNLYLTLFMLYMLNHLNLPLSLIYYNLMHKYKIDSHY